MIFGYDQSSPTPTYRKQTHGAKNYMDHAYTNPRSDKLTENKIIWQQIIWGTIILTLDQMNA